MLSYQHGYHAGNFADVLKHVALSRLLTYLIQKEKPLFYLETHSGKGLYDLRHQQAEKTSEYKEGIQLIWNNLDKLPSSFAEYIHIIKGLNPTHSLRHYPGSPYLAINIVRSIDRVYLCELHSGEFDLLKTLSSQGKKVHFSNGDGMTALNALLPPPEKRGLIFIDPSYEVKEEYKTIPQDLKKAFAKFSQGVYCLWYPVVNQRLKEQFIRRLQEIPAAKMLRIEFNRTTPFKEGMTGCGLWLINPPYTFAEEMNSIANTLKKYFNTNESSFIIESYNTTKN